MPIPRGMFREIDSTASRAERAALRERLSSDAMVAIGGGDADPPVAPVQRRLASIRSRVLAGLLDMAFAFGPALVVVLLRDQRLVEKPLLTVLTAIVGAIILFGGPVSLVLTNGLTPGRRLLGIRVVRTNGGRMTFRCALLRATADLTHRDFFLLGTLGAMLTDQSRRSRADRRAGTVVVCDER